MRNSRSELFGIPGCRSRDCSLAAVEKQGPTLPDYAAEHPQDKACRPFLSRGGNGAAVVLDDIFPLKGDASEEIAGRRTPNVLARDS
jgi:hypothetical protein